MPSPLRPVDPERMQQELERTLAPVSRRKVLLGALALGTAVLGVRACVPGPQRPVPPGIDHLSAEAYAFWHRVVEVFLPVDGSGLTPLERVPVLRNLDQIFGALDPKLRRDLELGLRLFEYGSIALGFHLVRFTNLDDAAAQAYFDRWMRGTETQQAIFNAMKQFVLVAYWKEPATWGPVDYDGPVTRKLHHPRLGNAPSPVI